MPGDSPREALNAYTQPIQQALHCITPAKLSGSTTEQDKTGVFTFMHDNPPYVELKRRTENGDRLQRIFLGIDQGYRIIADPDDSVRGPYRVHIESWNYKLLTRQHKEFIGFHWHPNETSTMTIPHLHIGSVLVCNPDLSEDVLADYEAHVQERGFLKGFSKNHIPTERIAIEHIVTMCIKEFQVEPLRDDWEELLQHSEQDFRRFRSWPQSYSSASQ